MNCCQCYFRCCRRCKRKERLRWPRHSGLRERKTLVYKHQATIYLNIIKENRSPSCLCHLCYVFSANSNHNKVCFTTRLERPLPLPMSINSLDTHAENGPHVFLERSLRPAGNAQIKTDN